ncbi:50S ribosomal protein L32e [Methanohalobium sp.]|uniref:50S ribosomal protein L32e n=1 Tax=Methanohalobium sp. TaxID=2837493 RepID=UPI0025EE0D95|nr:50S ribosomal protein L32e [Methanohalobium sp.]
MAKDNESNVSELEMDEESKRLFNIRKVQKSKKPSFNRVDSHRLKRMPSSWRRPKGVNSKLRKGIKAKGSLVKVGYGSPEAVKGLHPSGYTEILVYNVKDVENISNPSSEAIRIGRTVGAKKRTMIEEKAAELGIKVLNPSRGEE